MVIKVKVFVKGISYVAVSAIVAVVCYLLSSFFVWFLCAAIGHLFSPLSDYVLFMPYGEGFSLGGIGLFMAIYGVVMYSTILVDHARVQKRLAEREDASKE